MDMNPYEDEEDDEDDDNDIYGNVDEDDADFIEDAMTDNNNTNVKWQKKLNGRRASKSMEHP